jgi:hypothetical protein
MRESTQRKMRRAPGEEPESGDGPDLWPDGQQRYHDFIDLKAAEKVIISQAAQKCPDARPLWRFSPVGQAGNPEVGAIHELPLPVLRGQSRETQQMGFFQQPANEPRNGIATMR